MDNVLSSDIETAAKPVLKRIWKVGDAYLVGLDKKIVDRLGISEENNTYLEQEVTEDGIGIQMRVRNLDGL